MKWRNLFMIKFAAVLLLIGLTGFFWIPKVNAATADVIEQAIVKGLAWLAAQQNPDGSWGSGCDSIAYTGLAVLKFETRAIELGVDPLGTEYAYAANVKKGLDYIMGFAQTTPISHQPAGNPDGDGDGIGLYYDMCVSHQSYNTAISMMALAASGHPETYAGALQDAVDFMAWTQADDYCGPHRGGWRYYGNQCWSDNSNTGYVTLGLGFAQAPPYGFGLTIPEFVKQTIFPMCVIITLIMYMLKGEVMVRTQIQLTEEQSRALKALAARRGVSVAELVRQDVDNFVRSSTGLDDKERRRRAIAAAGKFRSGQADIATRHDDYLTEAYAR